MAKARVGDTELYYEVYGKGEPLLLIAGLGYASWSWFCQVERFAESYQTIVFDNRGVGESDKPDIPYSIAMLADDTAGLLASLDIPAAHILGVSMGGFVAQEIALRHPEIIKSLVLGCTSFGGPDSIPITETALNSMLNVQGLTPEGIIRQGFKTALSEDFRNSRPEVIDRMVGWRLEKPTPRYAWERQFMAATTFNTESRLNRIKAPVLVITGADDLVIPARNSELLAAGISGAELVIMPGGGHLFFVEQAKEFNRRVLDFLDRV